jgi:polar amino acid transport system substrate-binding protein
MDDIAKSFAPAGMLRVGINFGNPVVVQKDATGTPRGVGPALASELASRLGVRLMYVAYETAGKMADAVKMNAWDVAFLARDPARATDIDFTAPYMLIEGTYMVPRDSALRTVAEVDREGVRIAVGHNTAYDLFLAREIKHATLVRADSSAAAIEQFRADKLEAVAGVRQPLEAAAKANPDWRVMDRSFMEIGQAAGVPRGRAQAAAYLHRFIEEAKANGFVAKALAASGQGATVAPAEGSPR